MFTSWPFRQTDSKSAESAAKGTPRQSLMMNYCLMAGLFDNWAALGDFITIVYITVRVVLYARESSDWIFLLR